MSEGPVTPAARADWAARTAEVMAHVRANLDGDLSLATLAAVARSAPHHFQRIFTALVGESPASFARRARVERAAYLMMAAPSRSLTRIAADVGFAGSSDFSRSFRLHYGIPPSAWDRRTDLAADIRAPRPPVPDPQQLAALEAATRVIQLPRTTLAVVQAPGIIGLDDMRTPYAALLDWARSAGVDPDQQQLVGMSSDHYVATPTDRIHYSFGLSVPDEVVVQPPFSRRTIPATAAVALRCRGSLQEVAQAWEFLYGHWFPHTGHDPAAVPAMKWFHSRPEESEWQVWDLDCVIALTPP
ncbi:AraC family transcriptional regulator [Euzebya tangerina]|uniref:AraC family transcriptional regulator n=1 Tax=Euzebya tangerina TaxID=591198 RepID=UPI000E311387|nr:AraC family transcriptional regulator [Euzebya tangerina]